MLTLHPKEGVELLAVEVPEGFKFRVLEGNELYYSVQYLNIEEIGHLKFLPSGGYSFIATSRCTEEEISELVAEEPNVFARFKDYEGGSGSDSAIESLFSLIRSAGGDPDKHTYAILKKET